MKLDFPLDFPHKESRCRRSIHTPQIDPTALTEEKMPLIFLILCWYHCGHPFTVSTEYNAAKHRVTLQASCQMQTIIDTLKKISYNMPPGIEQDVTIVSNNTELSVDFITTNNSFDSIEDYKWTIIEQMLSSVSKQGYKFPKYNHLLKGQQHLMLVHFICFKRCLTLTRRGTAELYRGITKELKIADRNTNFKSTRHQKHKLISMHKEDSSLKMK
ncbi:uncharacterized protein LOC119972759 [Scyliorhinus canicula]|uniref:uncharacterized protein LOC119972759 n=1 Tax=Scyliorhinus canicula TaxID=7830 RepID=UPI0018F31B7D|nr:uncharacterized protein LOC119972759 [Scyliorhinus canicula]